MRKYRININNLPEQVRSLWVMDSFDIQINRQARSAARFCEDLILENKRLIDIVNKMQGKINMLGEKRELEYEKRGHSKA